MNVDRTPPGPTSEQLRLRALGRALNPYEAAPYVALVRATPEGNLLRSAYVWIQRDAPK